MGADIKHFALEQKDDNTYGRGMRLSESILRLDMKARINSAN